MFLFSQSKNEKKTLDNLVISLSDLVNFNQKIIEETSSTIEGREQLWSEFFEDRNLEIINEPNSSKNFKENVSSLGLKWVSEVNSNFKHDITDSEDIFSRFRISTGLDWVLYGDGSFFDNKREVQNWNTVIKRDRYRRVLDDNNLVLKEKLIFIESIFDLRRLSLLDSYQMLVSKEYEHYLKMYNAELIDENTLLKNKQELERIEHSIEWVKAYNNFSDTLLLLKYQDLSFSEITLPDLLDLESLIVSGHQAKLYELDQQVLLAKSRENNSSGMNLRLKMRYNYSEYRNHASQTYPSVGVTLSVPLQVNKAEKNVQYQLDEQSRRYQQDIKSTMYDLKRIHRNFYEVKMELVNLQKDLTYNQQLIKIEISKIDSTRNVYSPVNYLSLCKQNLMLQNNIIDKQQELCNIFIQFYLKSGIEVKFDKQKRENLLEQREMLQGEFSTYLWSHFFKEVNNDLLIAQYKKNRINKVFFSPSDAKKDKVDQFLASCQQSGIEVYRLISENSYATADNKFNKLQVKLEEALNTGYTGIHLNIEPHTFADYKDNQIIYTQRMNTLFEQSKKWCDRHNIDFSVSIPMNTPDETAKLLHSYSIPSYIMGYENNNVLKLLNRTTRLRTLLGDNIAWAVRVSDFDSLSDLQKAIQLLQKEGILQLAYYDSSLLAKILK